MRIQPATIPSNSAGTNFSVPEYQPKEVSIFGDRPLMTENYIEEVKNILDIDGDQRDENGNFLADYLDTDGDCEIDVVSYFEYDEDGNRMAEYYDNDNDGEIDEYD